MSTAHLRGSGGVAAAFAARPFTLAALLLLPVVLVAQDADIAALVADRTAIERVYYNHRLGEKPSFEQVLPRETIERLVCADLRKEAALERTCGVVVTPAMLSAEVQRINTTTRAPEMLAELKAALGNDSDRFARTVARPIVVERVLRARFENDDAVHASQRRACETVRNELLAGKTNAATTAQLLTRLKRSHSNAVTETTWQLTPRPAATSAPAAGELENKQRFGPEAQTISSPRQAERDRKSYFEDLAPALQSVLRVQLRQRGDVSAVIEMPGGFLLYVCKEKTAETLSVAVLSIPKKGLEEWLSEQAGGGR